ncbi:MAG TPA: hypothetical protein PLF13_12800 [candidate division Zixibacteria bacterium]|nr:hypothetical protein [candidate division Zixibacteria bacterium]
MQRMLGVVLVLTLCLIGVVAAQTTEDLTVTGVDLDNPIWGSQTFVVHMTNNTVDFKFTTIVANVDFIDNKFKTNRRIRTSFVMPPESKMVLQPLLIIPGDYGKARIEVRYYDVVDTVDEIFEYQHFDTDTLYAEFAPTEEVEPYLDKDLTLPPRVAEHPYFDQTVARLILLMLSEGKAVSDIARITGASEKFILDQLRLMVKNEYVTQDDAGYHTTFTVIGNEEAREAAVLAQELADSLTAIIGNNLPVFRDKLADMVANKKIGSDPNLFMDPGSVLYHEYPVVGGLALWTKLGRSFITRSAPLLIYDGTDLCNARIPNYMYLTHGGSDLNGDQFYGQFISLRQYAIYFGDGPVPIICSDDFLRRAEMGLSAKWTLPDTFNFVSFTIDTTLVEPALEILTSGTDSLLWHTYIKLRDVATKYGHPRLDYAERYWFWNLVATRTLKQLAAEGIVTREGLGQYRFNSI